MLFIFVKTDFLLRNKWSLYSVNRACSRMAAPSRQMDINHQKLVSSSAEAVVAVVEGPVNSGPPGP